MHRISVDTPSLPGCIARPCRAGFTLIELLVVVAIIASLIAILLPSMNESRRLAKEVTCGVDIRMLIVTSQTYANEYGGWFPQMASNETASFTQAYPYWAYSYWRKLIEKNYGVQRSHWYAPTNPVWNDDELYLWGWDGTDPDTATHMVMGRFYFGTEKLTNLQAFKNGIVDPAIPTNGRVFAAKADHKAYSNLMWTDLNRKWSGTFVGAGNRFGSNHLYEAGKDHPDGNHLGQIDGAVEWVPGVDVELRIQYPTPAAADLYW